MLCSAMLLLASTLPLQPALERDPDPGTLRALETIVNLEFDTVSFSDAIDRLREQCRLNVDVNWAALETAGIEKDAEVTLDLRNVSCKTALQLILDQIGGGETALEFVVVGNVVRVSTGEDLSRLTFARVYDVSDFAKGPIVSLTLKEQSADGPPESQTWTAPEGVTQLVDTLHRQIDPDSWQVYGGNAGVIQPVGSTLVITQSVGTQRRIKEFLAELRAARQPVDIDAVVMRLPRDASTAWRTGIGARFPRLTPQQFALIADGRPPGAACLRFSSSGTTGEPTVLRIPRMPGGEKAAKDKLRPQPDARHSEALSLSMRAALSPDQKATSIDVTLSSDTTEPRPILTTSIRIGFEEAVALSFNPEPAAPYDDWLVIRARPAAR